MLQGFMRQIDDDEDNGSADYGERWKWFRGSGTM